MITSTYKHGSYLHCRFCSCSFNFKNDYPFAATKVRILLKEVFARGPTRGQQPRRKFWSTRTFFSVVVDRSRATRLLHTQRHCDRCDAIRGIRASQRECGLLHTQRHHHRWDAIRGIRASQLECGLLHTHQMTQKPMLRAEVYAHAMRTSQNRKEEVCWGRRV